MKYMGKSSGHLRDDTLGRATVSSNGLREKHLGVLEEQRKTAVAGKQQTRKKSREVNREENGPLGQCRLFYSE